MTLAVMSGIGGGGIIVSLLMVFFSLDTKRAIAVSGVTILVGSLTRFMTTMQKRHPDKDSTVIDYGISNVMLPTVLIGSLIGVFMNLILPDLVLQMSLTVLLIFLTVQSGGKAMQIYHKESLAGKTDENGKQEKT